MNLTSTYQCHPGHCFCCGNSTSGKILDLAGDDLSQVRRFHVYLCETCVTAAFMMLDSSKVLIDKQKLADLEGENTALSNEVSRLLDEATAMDVRLAKAMRAEVDA